MTKLFFYHDPMCSWCWGYRPTGDKLFASLPPGVQRVNVLGGLAPDNDEPMPAQLLQRLPKTWQRIQDMLGTEFNFDFWKDCRPRRSTYPACRAVLAAGLQDHYYEMLEAIQHAYYLRALNPSDLSTLESLAAELRLDERRFATDIRAGEVDRELTRQVDFARRSPIRGFPSLVLEIDGLMQALTLDYRSHETTLAEIVELAAS